MEVDQHSNQRNPSPISTTASNRHYRAITVFLLVLIAIQVVIYALLSHFSSLETQTAVQQASNLPETKVELSKLIQFSKDYSLQPLQKKAEEFELKIAEREKGGYDVLLNKTLQELHQRQARLLALRQQSESVQKAKRGGREQTTSDFLDDSSTEYSFIFPKKMWVFDELKDGYFQRMNSLYHANNQRVAKQNSYQIHFVNRFNYISFVDRSKISSVTHTIQILRTKITTDNRTSPDSLTENMVDDIQKTLIMLLLLDANGGVAISQGVVLLQSFDWLRSITKNIFINRAKPGILPRVFGFYNISRGSPRVQQKQRDKNNRFKFLVKYPGIMPYFLAAVKGSQFIRDLLRQCTELLQNPTSFIRKTEKMRKVYKSEFLYFISHNKVYDEFFEIAVMTALMRKEYEATSGNGMIGIDHYGLVTMNGNYGPEKIGFFFLYHQGKKILRHLTQFQLSQFQLEIGPNRYLSKLPSYYQLNDYADNITQYKQTMIKNSFFHLHFFPHSEEKFIINRLQVPRIDKEAEPWKDLPKIIWVYWGAGIENSNIIYQLCADNIRRKGSESGFQLNIVSDSNLHEYLDNETIESITYAVAHQASLIKSPYIKYDLIRLALISRHGGIYMDLSYILLENLDWLVNIGQYPSNLIFNRYGTLPQVFMFFHPHFGSPFNITVNTYVNSKVSWHLGYENNFIAAVKDSELVTEWFQALLNATQTPYEDLEKEFTRCNMIIDRWTSVNYVYLLAMDIIKYVLARKQKEFEASGDVEYWDSSDYYKIWTMNGYMGQQKFRSHTSYDTNTHDNLFLRICSQQDSQLILGKALHLVKLYNYPVKRLLANFVANYNNLALQFHEESIFMKYLYNSSRHSVEISGKKQEKQRLIIRSDV